MTEIPNGKSMAFEELPTELQDAARDLVATLNDDGLTPEKRQEILASFILTFAGFDSEVSETLAALCTDATGQTAGHRARPALTELGHAWLGCLAEMSRDMPNRWSDVLTALRNGRTAKELFPDGLYGTANLYPATATGE